MATVVSAADHDLTVLQPLAEGIFGARGRAPGWFRRKLVREAVDPQMSSLVLGTGDAPVGYMLVGVGDHDTGETHGAGLGLLPAWRGQGLGPALVEATSLRLAAAGISAVRLLADPHHHMFYRRHGFTEIGEQLTMGAPGTAPHDLEFHAHPPRPWPLPGKTLAQWSAGTWERTPAAQSASLTLVEHAAWAHVSREGRGVLVHRLAAVDDACIGEALHCLRARFSAATPLFLHGCEPVSSVTASCLATGWQVVQHAHVMQRRFW